MVQTQYSPHPVAACEYHPSPVVSVTLSLHHVDAMVVINKIRMAVSMMR